MFKGAAAELLERFHQHNKKFFWNKNILETKILCNVGVVWIDGVINEVPKCSNSEMHLASIPKCMALVRVNTLTYWRQWIPFGKTNETHGKIESLFQTHKLTTNFNVNQTCTQLHISPSTTSPLGTSKISFKFEFSSFFLNKRTNKTKTKAVHLVLNIWHISTFNCCPKTKYNWRLNLLSYVFHTILLFFVIVLLLFFLI